MEPFGDARIHVNDPEPHATVELEDGRRQLPRGLPRSGRAPRADAAARLQALFGGDHATPTRLRRAVAGRRHPTTGPSGSTSGWSARCPGSIDEDHRIFRYIAIYPNTVIDLYPDHVLLWKMNPRGVDQVDVPGTYCDARIATCAPASRRRLNLYVSKITTHEDEDLVHRMQIGLGNTDFRPGPAVAAREGGGLVRRPHPRRPGRSGPGAGPMMSTGSMTRRTRAEIAAETREAILSAAAKSSPTIGFEKIRMRMVAERAGVSTAALHYHFDTREKLFAEALRYSFEHTGAMSTKRGRDQTPRPTGWRASSPLRCRRRRTCAGNGRCIRSCGAGPTANRSRARWPSSSTAPAGLDRGDLADGIASGEFKAV